MTRTLPYDRNPYPNDTQQEWVRRPGERSRNRRYTGDLVKHHRCRLGRVGGRERGALVLAVLSDVVALALQGGLELDAGLELAASPTSVSPCERFANTPSWSAAGCRVLKQNALPRTPCSGPLSAVLCPWKTWVTAAFKSPLRHRLSHLRHAHSVCRIPSFSSRVMSGSTLWVAIRVCNRHPHARHDRGRVWAGHRPVAQQRVSRCKRLANTSGPMGTPVLAASASTHATRRRGVLPLRARTFGARSAVRWQRRPPSRRAVRLVLSSDPSCAARSPSPCPLAGGVPRCLPDGAGKRLPGIII
jgi:hypothetical protein